MSCLKYRCGVLALFVGPYFAAYNGKHDGATFTHGYVDLPATKSIYQQVDCLAMSWWTWNRLKDTCERL